MPVEFEDNAGKSPSILGTPKTPKMVEALVKSGIVKSESGAMKLMLWGSIILLVIAIIILILFVLKVGNSDIPDPRFIPQP